MWYTIGKCLFQIISNSSLWNELQEGLSHVFPRVWKLPSYNEGDSIIQNGSEMRVQINVANGNTVFLQPHTSNKYCISIWNLVFFEAFAVTGWKFGLNAKVSILLIKKRILQFCQMWNHNLVLSPDFVCLHWPFGKNINTFLL